MPSALEVLYGSGKPSIKAWGAALPPTGISIPASSLAALRTTVQSTVRRKPEFETRHPTLTPVDTDLKKTLGQPMDVSASLARVQPVRPTKVLYNADYVTWSDHATRRCRTAPENWYNHHPAAPAPQSDGKYPWS